MRRFRRALLWLAGILVLLALVPFLLPRPGIDGRIPERPFSDSRFGEVDGVRLHWRQRDGAGAARPELPLVVLIHGFGGSSFSWRYALDAFEASGYPAIAPDLPPFGYSQRTAAGPDWPSLVLALADRIAPERRLFLVGHSMGTGVAADLASRVPDRVDGLVMVGGTPGTRRGGPGWTRLLALPPVGRSAEVFAARRLLRGDRIDRMLETALGRPPLPEESEGYRLPLTVPGTYPALLARMARRAPAAADWTRVPTHLVWGEHDDRVPIERGLALIERHPEAGPMRIIEGSGHNPMDTHPEVLDRILLELAQAARSGDRHAQRSADRAEAQ